MNQPQTNAPAILNHSLLAGSQFDWRDAAALKVFHDTKCSSLNDAERIFAVEYCKATGLNPMRNEIWFIASTYQTKTGESKRQFTAMTGVNGFHTLANRHPQYDGMEHDVEFDEKGNLRSAWCKVYRKDRSHPHMCRVFLKEYDRSAREPYGNWAKMPCTMLEKVAICRALREAFPQDLGSIYGDVEFAANYGDANAGQVIDADFERVEASQPLPSPKPKTAADMVPVVETRKAAKDGQTWVYDLGPVEGTDEEKLALFDSLNKSHGALKDDEGYVHTIKPVPSLEPVCVRKGKEFEPQTKLDALKLKAAEQLNAMKGR